MTSSALLVAILTATLAQPPSGIERIGRVATGGGERPREETQVGPPSMPSNVEWAEIPWEEAAHRQALHRLQYDLSDELTKRLMEVHAAKRSLEHNPKPLQRSYLEARRDAFDEQAKRTRRLVEMASTLESQPVDLASLPMREAAADLLRYAHVYGYAMTEAKRRIATSDLGVGEREAQGQDAARPRQRGERHRTEMAQSQARMARALGMAESVLDQIGRPIATHDLEEATRIALEMEVAGFREHLAILLEKHEGRFRRFSQRIETGPSKELDAYDREELESNGATIDAIKTVESLASRFRSDAVSVETLATWVAAFDAAARTVDQVALYSDLGHRGRSQLAKLRKGVPTLQATFDELEAEANFRQDPARYPAPSPRPHAKADDAVLRHMMSGAGKSLHDAKNAVYYYEQRIPFASDRIDQAQADLKHAVVLLERLIDEPASVDRVKSEAFAGRPLARDILYRALISKSNAARYATFADEVQDELPNADAAERKVLARLYERYRYAAQINGRLGDRSDTIAAPLLAIAEGKANASSVTLRRVRKMAVLYAEAEDYHFHEWLRVTMFSLDAYASEPSVEAAGIEAYVRANTKNRIWPFFEKHGDAVRDAWPNAVAAVVAE